MAKTTWHIGNAIKKNGLLLTAKYTPDLPTIRIGFSLGGVYQLNQQWSLTTRVFYFFKLSGVVCERTWLFDEALGVTPGRDEAERGHPSVGSVVARFRTKGSVTR